MEHLNVLHLSDLHIGNFRYETPEPLAIKIANTINDQGRKVDIVIFSGDIFDGRSNSKDEDQKNALLFFKTLITQINAKKLSLSKFCETDILFVPGNHDLVRQDNKQYKKYDDFIKEFYPKRAKQRAIFVDKYNFICDFPEKKIAILGFNSCKIHIDKVKAADLNWINKLDLKSFGSNEDKIKEIIRTYKEEEIKWDDFGYIEPIEMDNVFTTMKSIIPSYSDYNIIATFHHHFYPFPEIVKKNPDASFIRNYTEVLDQFQRYKIKLVLHGHKHLSIQRAITDNKFFENPDSIIYVLSAGSIGCKDVYNPSFQSIRVFDKNFSIVADGEKYDFKDEELDNVKKFIIPPQGLEEKGMTTNLIDELKFEDSSLYTEYQKITDDFEQVILDSQINKTIKIIGDLFTMFNDIKLELTRKPLMIYLLLLSINYRIILLKNHYNQKPNLELLLIRLQESMRNILKDSTFIKNLILFLSSISNNDIEKNYHAIIKNVTSSDKRIGAYCSIGLFLTDLFLNISNYGEFYFEKEKLNHKINIQLKSDTFYESIPSDSISIEGDIDRRAIVLNFKSKNPTVHKVAVLIVKDFEMRLDKFEESLKEIRLKLYYIIPKVHADKYDLENFHFDAYIPTLLPLLTGDNLYKSKEVFIRELVQNSIDATLLRQKIEPDVKFDSSIKIELGSKVRNSKKVKYFRIIDNGIGMSKFTIERYFTSIGRSFYVSEEFDDLKKDKKIQYDAISNFGIGFLSSFMVCQEVFVQTKNILNEDGTNGLEIEIPNYDGCFFIRSIEREIYGTDIVLYEDERKLFDFKKFIDYIKNTLIGLPVAINVEFNDSANKDFQIESYDFQRSMLKMMLEEQDLIFYIPFSESLKNIDRVSWNELQEKNINSLPKFGIWFNFSKLKNERIHSNKDLIFCANQGLKITFPHTPFKYNSGSILPEVRINYPSSFIQLDVARERILKLNNEINLEDIGPALHQQFYGFLKSASNKLSGTKISAIQLINYYLINDFKIDTFKTIVPEIFTIKLEKIETGIHLSICQLKDIPSIHLPSTCYINLSDSESFIQFIKFIFTLNLKNVKVKYKNSHYTEFKNTMERNNLDQFRYQSSKRFHLFEDRFITDNIFKDDGSKFFSRKDIIELKRDMERNELEMLLEYDFDKKPLMLNSNKDYELLLYFLLDKDKERMKGTIKDLMLNSFMLFKIFVIQTVNIRDYKNFKLFLDFENINWGQEEIDFR